MCTSVRLGRKRTRLLSQNLTLHEGGGRICLRPPLQKSVLIDVGTLQRFWSKVDKRGPTADHMDSRCWVWKGSKDKDGYGRFSVKGKSISSHRFSFLVATGQLPEQVMHKCNNPSCERSGNQKARIRACCFCRSFISFTIAFISNYLCCSGSFY